MPLLLKTWTRCSALFVSGALLWAPAALACAGDDPAYDGLYNSTFSASAVCRADEAPLFLHFNRWFATEDGVAAPDFTKLNLDEWVAFFGGKIPAEAWSKLLYKDPLSRLDALIFALQGKPGATEADQLFLAYADRPTLVAALFYVGFAKRVETWVPQLTANYWDGLPKPTATGGPEALEKQLTAGKKAYGAATNPFLKQRYAFQLLRLYFHQRSAEEGVRFFEEHAAEFSTASNSSTAWRAKGLGAGLLRKAGRSPEANVLYSELYDRFPPMKVSALQSFSWRDDATWNQSLARAKTTREKTVLWQALGYRSDGPRAMRAIRDLDPTSELVFLPLVRELNRLEEEVGRSNALQAPTLKALTELRTFVEAGSEKGNVAMPAAWDLAAGHLHVLMGDVPGAQRFFDRAAKRPNLSPALQQQLRVSRFFGVIESKVPLTPSDDASVVTELEWLWPNTADERLANLKTRARSQVAKKLTQRGDVYAAVCIGGDLAPVATDPNQTARFYEFLTTAQPGVLQAFVSTHCAFKAEAIRQLQGLVALYQGDLGQAATLLAKDQGKLIADPFASRVVDCHDCDAADPKHKIYTRAQFVQRMATLAKSKSAQSHFELATGLYNMTFHGNGRAMYWGTLLMDTSPATHDTKAAEGEFRKVLTLTKDKELIARATFGLAKCELAQFYETRKDGDTRDFVAGPAFKALAASSAGTSYYAEVLQECGYFRTFAGR